MIDHEVIRRWFRLQMQNAAIDLSDFAWEGTAYDPSTLDFFIGERLVPFSETTSSNKADELSAFLFYDVVSKKGDGTEVTGAKLKQIADVFFPPNNKETEIETDLKIDIDEATSTGYSDYSDAQVVNSVRIRFRAYYTY